MAIVHFGHLLQNRLWLKELIIYIWSHPAMSSSIQALVCFLHRHKILIFVYLSTQNTVVVGSTTNHHCDLCGKFYNSNSGINASPCGNVIVINSDTEIKEITSRLKQWSCCPDSGSMEEGNCTGSRLLINIHESGRLGETPKSTGWGIDRLEARCSLIFHNLPYILCLLHYL